MERTRMEGRSDDTMLCYYDHFNRSERSSNKNIRIKPSPASLSFHYMDKKAILKEGRTFLITKTNTLGN